MLSTLALFASVNAGPDELAAPMPELSDKDFRDLVKLTHHGPGAAMGQKGFELQDWKNAVIKTVRLPVNTPERLRCDEESRSKLDEETLKVMGECVFSNAELVKKHGLGSISPSWAHKVSTLACEPQPIGKVDVSCHQLNCNEETMICHPGHDATVYEALTNEGEIINLHCHEWTDEDAQDKQRCHAVAEGDRVYMQKSNAAASHTVRME